MHSHPQRVWWSFALFEPCPTMSGLTPHPPPRVPPSTVTVLTTFFQDRFRDLPCLTEALDGLLALVRYQALAGPAAADLAMRCAIPPIPRARSHLPRLTACYACTGDSLLVTVNLAGQPQPVRLTAYHLLGALLERHTPALRARGPEFVFNAIRCMDGEKDPRNLLYKLGVLRQLATSFPLSDELAEVPARLPACLPALADARNRVGVGTQDLFDALACYFPITFTPPPNDPFAISSDELRTRLRYAQHGPSSSSPFPVLYLRVHFSPQGRAGKRGRLWAAAPPDPAGEAGLGQPSRQGWTRFLVLAREESGWVSHCLYVFCSTMRWTSCASAPPSTVPTRSPRTSPTCARRSTPRCDAGLGRGPSGIAHTRLVLHL